MQKIQNEFHNVKIENEFHNAKNECCTNNQVKKIIELIQSDVEPANYTITEKLLGSQMSLVRVYFKKLGVVMYSTQENYSLMDLIGKS